MMMMMMMMMMTNGERDSLRPRAVLRCFCSGNCIIDSCGKSMLALGTGHGTWVPITGQKPWKRCCLRCRLCCASVRSLRRDKNK